MEPPIAAPAADEIRLAIREDRRTFFPVLAMGSLFVMTLLVYVSAMFGDSTQPINQHPQHAVKQSILNNGLPVILGEAVLLAAVSFRAMAQDRRITLERQKAQDDLPHS